MEAMLQKSKTCYYTSMPVICEKFNVDTKGHTDIIDITEKVKELTTNRCLGNACVVVCVTGSTASLTTLEYERGLLKDLPEMLEKIAPTDKVYHHDETWHDGNGYAHVRAAMIGNSVSIPLINNNLELGTWQQIVLIDFDNKARTRCINIQIIY